MLQRSLDRARARKAAGDAGFTLIELLIVIVILGILAAIVVLSVAGITDKGKSSACKAQFETSITALEAYYANNNNAYPASMGALVPLYIASDPSAGTVDVSSRVTYTQTGSGTGYTLTSGSGCNPVLTH